MKPTIAGMSTAASGSTNAPTTRGSAGVARTNASLTTRAARSAIACPTPVPTPTQFDNEGDAPGMRPTIPQETP
jgi:hypothetical protein